MKLLVFNWRDVGNPAAGGAEVFTQAVAERLVAQDHAVTVEL